MYKLLYSSKKEEKEGATTGVKLQVKCFPRSSGNLTLRQTQEQCLVSFTEEGKQAQGHQVTRPSSLKLVTVFITGLQLLSESMWTFTTQGHQLFFLSTLFLRGDMPQSNFKHNKMSPGYFVI